MNAYIIFKDRDGNVLGTIPAPEGVVVENPLVITVNGLCGIKPNGVISIKSERKDSPRVRTLTVRDYRPVKKSKKKPDDPFGLAGWLDDHANRVRRYQGRDWHPTWFN